VADCAVQAHSGYLPSSSPKLDLGAYPHVQASIEATQGRVALPGGDGQRANSLMGQPPSLRLAGPPPGSCSAAKEPSGISGPSGLLAAADLAISAKAKLSRARNPLPIDGDRAHPQCPSGSAPPLAPPGRWWSRQP